MVCHHTLEPVDFIGHIAVCPLKNIEPVVDALRTLLSHHAKTNSTLPDEQHHMVFEHVEFAHDRCFRESSTIVPDELVDVVKYMYGYNCAGVGSSQEASPLFDLPTPAQLKRARKGKAWNVEPSVRMCPSRLGM